MPDGPPMLIGGSTPALGSTQTLSLARAAAERVLLARVTPLIGRDYKGEIPKLQARVAAIRAGMLDSAPEVQSVLEALRVIGGQP